MKKARFCIALSLFALFAALSFASEAQKFRSVFSKNDGRYFNSGATAAYKNYLSEAIAERAKGDLMKATTSFESASKEAIHEFPNYELWPDLVELYCVTGKRDKAVILLKEYDCAVDLMAGRHSCERISQESFPRCYGEMCHPIYASYFGQRANGKIVGQERDQKDAAIVKKLTQKCDLSVQ